MENLKKWFPPWDKYLGQNIQHKKSVFHRPNKKKMIKYNMKFYERKE